MSMHSPGTILFHFYEILSNIGQGGMGAVYKARDLRSGEVVALKQMREDSPSGFVRTDLKERFEKEWRVLAALNHPRIPRMIAHFTHRDSIYYVMEFVEGKSLDALLDDYRARRERFPEILMLEFALQILEVMVYLHNLPRPLVHRDIKPQNIIVRADNGELVLVDFGLARDTGSASTKTLVGTLGYAPLEQVKGHPEPRSDIYALGATMFHMLSGGPPAPFDIPLLEKERPDVHPGLAEIVNRACKNNPNQRYASAVRMEMAVRQLLAHLKGEPDERLAQLYMEDQGPIIEIRRSPEQLPPAVFLMSLVAGCLLVLVVLVAASRFKDGWAQSALPVRVHTPTPGLPPGGYLQPTPPPQPNDVPPPETGPAPGQIKLRQATEAERSLAQGIFSGDREWQLLGIAGQMTPAGSLEASPNQPAGLWLERQRPLDVRTMTFQVVRETGPGDVQVQLAPKNSTILFGTASSYDAASRRFINGLTLEYPPNSRRGDSLVCSESIISLFFWAHLESDGRQTSLTLDGVEGVSRVPAPLNGISIMRVLVPAANHVQRLRLQSVSLVGR